MTPFISRDDFLLPGKRYRYHPVYSLAILKKPAIVCAVPLLNALIEFNLQALFLALKQELFLVATLLVLGVFLWCRAWWSVESPAPDASPETLVLCRNTGTFFQLLRRTPADTLASLAVRRCWYLRPLGAVRLEFTLFSGQHGRLLLTRRRAEALLDTLLPLPEETADFSPTRRERGLLALVSCDFLATLTVIALVLHNASQVMGRSWAEQTAQRGVSTVAAFLARWIPVGLSGIAALGLLLLCATLSISFLRTAQISLKRGGDVLEAQSGIFTRVQWRVRRRCITCVDLRKTPLARALRAVPVSFCAGGRPETPVLLWRPGQEDSLCRLLPGFRLPPQKKQNLNRRSLMAYALLPALGVAACILLFVLLNTLWVRFFALWPLLFLPGFYFAALCVVGVEGYLRDGIFLPPNADVVAASRATVLVHSTRLFTHHLFCVFCPNPALQLVQNPISQFIGRCNARVLVPGHTTAPLRAKSVLSAPLKAAWEEEL